MATARCMATSLASSGSRMDASHVPDTRRMTADEDANGAASQHH
jgi:hypothetical protein